MLTTTTELQRSAAPVARPGTSPATAFAAARRYFRWLTPADCRVLYLYLLTRVATVMTAYCAVWLFPSVPEARTPCGIGTAFQQWDWYHFFAIARDGYFPGDSGPWTDQWDNREAFLPGFPLALKAVHAVIPHWTLAGLVISFVSGAVAVVALARIARSYRPEPSVGQDAVLFLLLSPCAIFLAVGYSEALFLAFALPAWSAVQRHKWALAGILAAGAASVRITGLFLAAAIAVHFLVSIRSHRHWHALPWLAVPALPVVTYFFYLYWETGDWSAWQHAQERGWARTFTSPWDAWATTWTSAFGHAQTTGFAIVFQAELVAMVIGLALLASLLYLRRWADAAYVALTVAALGTSYWYMSIPRATLLWWPLWICLAIWAQRHPSLKPAYLLLVAPLSTIVSLTYLTGRWAG